MRIIRLLPLVLLLAIPPSAHTQTLYPEVWSAYDSTLPTYDWMGNGIYGTDTVTTFAEQFGIPVYTTFQPSPSTIDSVSVMLDSITSDSITIAIFQDTLIASPNGDGFLVIDIFNYSDPVVAKATIYAKNVHRGQWTTAAFSNYRPPALFSIGIIAPLAANGKPAKYWIRGDVDTNASRSKDYFTTKYAVFICDSVNGHQSSFILDSS